MSDQNQSTLMLSVRHISDGVEKAKDYIHRRRTGEITSLKTPLNHLNNALLGGLDWWRIMTVAGASGAGKSTFLEYMKRGFLEDPNVWVLSFEFEMLIEDQLAKGVSAKIGKTVKEIYSAKTVLSKEDEDKVFTELDKLNKKKLFYVDNVGTSQAIMNTIVAFVEKFNPPGLVVTIDHTLLTKGKSGEGEKEKIDALMQDLVALKKYFAHEGVKVSFIVLSQLNRDIESKERAAAKDFHYPTKADLFAASSVYYCSDYVLVVHRPSSVNGMKDWYGPPRGEKYPSGLPVRDEDGTSYVYLHLLKERFGKPMILPTLEQYSAASFKEVRL